MQRKPFFGIDTDHPYDVPGSPSVSEAYRPTRQNVRGLLRAFYLSLVPHARNSPFRKRLTIIMFVTWGAITTLRAAGFAPLDPIIYWPLTVATFSIFFHMWGFEYGAIASAGRVNTQDGFERTRDDDDDRDRNGRNE